MKSKTIKTHLSKSYKDRLIQKANARELSVTDYLTELINKNIYKMPPHKLPYLINKEHDTLGIRIDESLFHQLKCKVEFEGMNVSEYLRELIYQDIRNGE